MRSAEFKQFEYLHSKAERLLDLRLGGEMAKGLRSVARLTEAKFRLPSISDPLDVAVRSFFGMGPDELFVILDDALCESVLVLGVTGLEVYLRQVGEHIQKKKLGLLESIPALQVWSKATHIDPFQAISRNELNQAFQWRHVIVHAGGKVDSKAIDNGLKNVREGDQARDKLTPHYTSQLLTVTKSVAESVDRQYLQLMRLET